MIIGFVSPLKTAETHKRQGLASKFIDTLRQFIEKQLADQHRAAYLVAAYLVVGMAEVMKPHAFFFKMGFKSPLPDFLQCWRQDNCQMAALHIRHYYGKLVSRINIVIRR